MKEVLLSDILHTLDVWRAEANNDHNDGWVQKDYKDRIDVIRKSLQEEKPPIKFEDTKEEMCF
tara:strand:+ start:258 stop:446 length:189 start_codon:yes stop_codon:yes gene_type:complete